MLPALFLAFLFQLNSASAQVQQRVASLEYQQLFSAHQQVPTSTRWSQNSWPGLVTFARSPPLRCWGNEADASYDVAVIGACSKQRSQHTSIKVLFRRRTIRYCYQLSSRVRGLPPFALSVLKSLTHTALVLVPTEFGKDLVV